MKFQYIFLVCIFYKHVLPSLIGSHCSQRWNSTQDTTLQALDELPELEDKIAKNPYVKTITKNKTCMEESTKYDFFENIRESKKDNISKLQHGENATSLAVHSGIDSKPLNKNPSIELDSPKRVWLNFPLQIELEMEKNNNDNSLYRIKSFLFDSDSFEFSNLFYGREYSTLKKMENPIEMISPTYNPFSSQRTPVKITPATRLHFPFHFKPPLQTRGYPISSNAANNNAKTTRTVFTQSGLGDRDFYQPNIAVTESILISKPTTVTPIKTTKKNRKPTFATAQTFGDFSIDSGYLPTTHRYPSTNSKSFDQEHKTIFNQENINIPSLDYLNLPTMTYPDIINHKGVLSKLKDYLKRKFGKNITPFPLYSGIDFENVFSNYDFQNNFNATLPFPLIEAITLPQTHEKYLKKSKLKTFLGRMFRTSSESIINTL
ncbi:uncharacterized protein LOC111063062 [Nilaparvata lugens]|uniref:uncharacterized protein LOC111063062 n=1 Tax=Nilaparvata lugens TaxID=108931 RepID=UPI000B97CF49|nr:uncharacterized protein LOC111063062 [Nilaparvata lugens]